MLKWIALAVVFIAVILYFAGALEIDNSAKTVDISVDKDKTKELGESIKKSLEN